MYNIYKIHNVQLPYGHFSVNVLMQIFTHGQCPTNLIIKTFFALNKINFEHKDANLKKNPITFFFLKNDNLKKY